MATGLWTSHVNTLSSTSKVDDHHSDNLSLQIQQRRKIDLFDKTTWPTFQPSAEGVYQCGVCNLIFTL